MYKRIKLKKKQSKNYKMSDFMSILISIQTEGGSFSFYTQGNDTRSCMIEGCDATGRTTQVSVLDVGGVEHDFRLCRFCHIALVNEHRVSFIDRMSE
jgi:hypothetical protein